MIYWLIGQPGSGKTTLAKALSKYIRTECNGQCIHLDGDELRVVFGGAYNPENFTEEYRKEQTKSLQRLIVHLSKQSEIIVSTVSPYKEVREKFKEENPGQVVEIYVHTDTPRVRGENWVDSFESPEKNYIDLNTTNKTIQESFTELLEKLSVKKITTTL